MVSFKVINNWAAALLKKAKQKNIGKNSIAAMILNHRLNIKNHKFTQVYFKRGIKGNFNTKLLNLNLPSSLYLAYSFQKGSFLISRLKPA